MSSGPDAAETCSAETSRTVCLIPHRAGVSMATCPPDGPSAEVHHVFHQTEFTPQMHHDAFKAPESVPGCTESLFPWQQEASRLQNLEEAVLLLTNPTSLFQQDLRSRCLKPASLHSRTQSLNPDSASDQESTDPTARGQETNPPSDLCVTSRSSSEQCEHSVPQSCLIPV